MAVKGLSISDTIDHVLDSDPSKRIVEIDNPDDPKAPKIKQEMIDEGATIWKLSGLDVFLDARVWDASAEFSQTEQGRTEARVNIAVGSIEAVRYGLKGWENFTDRQGNQIPFRTEQRRIAGREYQAVPDDLLRLIPLNDMFELSRKIRELSRLTETAAKNSDTALLQSA